MMAMVHFLTVDQTGSLITMGTKDSVGTVFRADAGGSAEVLMGDIAGGGNSTTLEVNDSTGLITLAAAENNVRLDEQPDGTVDLAVATTKYVDDEIAASNKLTHYSNELPTVTDGQAAVSALSNLGSHATVKVTNVEVYLNGVKQTPGGSNDYTLNASTGVITFTANLSTGDVVNVDYDSQDA
jgi:hypothetical protein